MIMFQRNSNTFILHGSLAVDRIMEEEMPSFELQLGNLLKLGQLKVNVITEQLAGDYAVSA